MKKSNTFLSDSHCVMNLTFMIILCTYDNHDCTYFVDEKLKFLIYKWDYEWISSDYKAREWW